MTDPIADMLTRIRNAMRARHNELTLASSSAKTEIAKILKEEGFIKDFGMVKEDGRVRMRVLLKYSSSKKGAITSISRVSKPGLRKYVGKEEIPRVLNGLGIAIISTSKGVMTDKKAREQGVGGEVICTVY